MQNLLLLVLCSRRLIKRCRVRIPTTHTRDAKKDLKVRIGKTIWTIEKNLIPYKERAFKKGQSIENCNILNSSNKNSSIIKFRTWSILCFPHFSGILGDKTMEDDWYSSSMIISIVISSVKWSYWLERLETIW